jgi:Sec-independent protein translocase protein TatA
MFTSSFVVFVIFINVVYGFINYHHHGRGSISQSTSQSKTSPHQLPNSIIKPFGSQIVSQRHKPLHDILGFGPAEIAITLVLGLILFGPETLKSLSKDVGRAAAELKEIPKTFKEGMDEGAQSSQVTRMKILAAEKRKKRDEKLAGLKTEDNDDVNEEEN